MSGSVASLMITMNGDVKTEIFGQVVVCTESKHVDVVPCHKNDAQSEMSTHMTVQGQLTDEIQVLVNAWKRLARVVDITVDPGCQSGKLGNQVDTVFEGICPVFRFLNTLFVGRREGRIVIQSSDAHSELCHGVQTLG